MHRQAKVRMMLSLMVTLVLAGVPIASSGQERSAAPEESGLKAGLVAAYAQHEIILLRIKSNEFDKVLVEARTLLSFRFPPEQELSTVKSLLIISTQLQEKGQTDLALKILDEATHAIADPTNQARVFLIQARIYKQAGQDEKALESYRRSLELLPKE